MIIQLLENTSEIVITIIFIACMSAMSIKRLSSGMVSQIYYISVLEKILDHVRKKIYQ